MTGYTWSPTKTFELIKLYETHTLLWDKTHCKYRNKILSAQKINDISVAISVPRKEIIRKLHNLRNQLCEEIRNGRKRNKFKDGEIPDSKWRYFSAMKFLISTVTSKSKINRHRRTIIKKEDSQKDTDGNLELNDTEETYHEKIPTKFLNNSHNERSNHYSLQCLYKVPREEKILIGMNEEWNQMEERRPEEQANAVEYKELDGMEEKCKKRISARYLNSTYDEQPKHSLQSLMKGLDEGRNNIECRETEDKYERIPTRFLNYGERRNSLRILPDEDDRFGEYVALELRGLRSEANKRRLKSEIRKAICRIADLDDADLLISCAQPEFITASPTSPKYSQICEISNVTSETT